VKAALRASTASSGAGGETSAKSRGAMRTKLCSRSRLAAMYRHSRCVLHPPWSASVGSVISKYMATKAMRHPGCASPMKSDDMRHAAAITGKITLRVRANAGTQVLGFRTRSSRNTVPQRRQYPLSRFDLSDWGESRMRSTSRASRAPRSFGQCTTVNTSQAE
jgi:hypothetical protein